MKSPHLLQIISVTALFAMTLNLSAGEGLLSPRGKDNQIKATTVADTSANMVTQKKNAVASPRGLDNQIKTVAATAQAADSMNCSRKMLASPRATGECASHPGAPMSCCSVATAK
jgi:hypothetical protein